MAEAAIWWYFPTKDHLLAEVFTRALNEEIELLASGSEDPFDRLIQGLVDLRLDQSIATDERRPVSKDTPWETGR